MKQVFIRIPYSEFQILSFLLFQPTQLKFKNWYIVPFTPRAYCVTNWEESLTYLREINAVKTAGNAFGNGCPVFLSDMRGYELTIVRSICKMMKNRHWLGRMEIDEKVGLLWRAIQ